MIIITKQGEKRELPYMQAFEEGVYSFTFHGDETYTDPFDGSVWNWENTDNDLEEVIGVINGTQRLIRTISINDCKALEKSYFWDDVNGVLYVHWEGSSADYSTGRESTFYSSVIEGYASGQHELTDNTFDGIYYPSVITAIGGLSRNVDPLKFGVLSFDESSLSITNQNGTYDNLAPGQVIGQPVFFYKVEDDDTELTDDMKIFSGFFSDFKNNKIQVDFKIIENRLFGNVPVCPNSASVDEYPDIGSLENSQIPAAWGDIRRGKMLLTNEADLAPEEIIQDGQTFIDSTSIFTDTTNLAIGMAVSGAGIPDDSVIIVIVTPTFCSMDNLGTASASGVELTFTSREASFLVADPSLNDDGVLAITNVYDENGALVNGGTANISQCSLTIQVPLDATTSDLKKWSWEGQGYHIDGTYNNGLDIIKDAFLKLASIPYLGSTFNTTEWDAATAANLEDIGISIQSTKGFTEHLIQPVTVSIQGILEIQGDGRISWKDRDITASPSATVKAARQQNEPVITEDSSQMVSELVVEYSQNFVDKDDKLIFINSDNQDTVISQYSIDRRDPLSPIKTLLFTESDASDLSDEIMSTSASPNRLIDYDSLDLSELRVFDVVCVDTGRFGEEDLEYGEILSVAPDYINVREKNKMRVIPNYTP